jgi:hypothetical protein
LRWHEALLRGRKAGHGLIIEPLPLVRIRPAEPHFLLTRAGIHDDPGLVQEVVESDDQIDEHEIGFGDIKVALRMLRYCLELTNKVVGKEPDSPTRKRRQTLDAFGAVIGQQLPELQERFFIHRSAPSILARRRCRQAQLHIFALRPEDQVGLCCNKGVPARPVIDPGALQQHGMAPRSENFERCHRGERRLVDDRMKRENASTAGRIKEFLF